MKITPQFLNNSIHISCVVVFYFSSLRVRLSPQTLHEHKVGLEVCVRHYNTLHQSLDPVHKGLFQHKLVLLDNVRY